MAEGSLSLKALKTDDTPASQGYNDPKVFRRIALKISTWSAQSANDFEIPPHRIGPVSP